MASSNNTAVESEVNTDLTGSDDVSTTTAVITLVGENDGAAGGDMAEDIVVVGNADGDVGEESNEEEEGESVVSAYQAVNSSVLVSGSCAVDDPGVHVIVVEHVDEISEDDDRDNVDAQEL